MATTTTKAALVEDALIAALQDRAGLAGVMVDVGPLGILADEMIQTVNDPSPISGREEWKSLGAHTRRETCEIHLEIYVRRPGAGATALREARDRAVELKAEIAELLREEMKNKTKFGGLVTFIQLATWAETRIVTEGNRISSLLCTIEYEAELRTT